MLYVASLCYVHRLLRYNHAQDQSTISQWSDMGSPQIVALMASNASFWALWPYDSKHNQQYVITQNRSRYTTYCVLSLKSTLRFGGKVRHSICMFMRPQAKFKSWRSFITSTTQAIHVQLSTILHQALVFSYRLQDVRQVSHNLSIVLCALCVTLEEGLIILLIKLINSKGLIFKLLQDQHRGRPLQPDRFEL